jgi:hypothetical protein
MNRNEGVQSESSEGHLLEQSRARPFLPVNSGTRRKMGFAAREIESLHNGPRPMLRLSQFSPTITMSLFTEVFPEIRPRCNTNALHGPPIEPMPLPIWNTRPEPASSTKPTPNLLEEDKQNRSARCGLPLKITLHVATMTHCNDNRCRTTPDIVPIELQGKRLLRDPA